MCRPIQVIPTFGTTDECYHRSAGYKPAAAKYSAELDGLDKWNNPAIPG